MKYITIISILTAGLLSVTFTSTAADQAQIKSTEQAQLKSSDNDQLQDKQIYGHQLMSADERNQFRQKMMSAKTTQEREQIRAEHHKTMQARAKSQGINLPDEPPMHRGPGSGMGGGMGPGGRN